MSSPRRSRTIAVWISALRPKTLGASLCPVMMGGALAWHDGVFALLPVLAALIGAWLLQIASNFANDLFDGVRGTDSVARLGPQRAVASGAIAPRTMKFALLLTLVFAAIPAVFLTMHGGLAFAAIAVVGAVCAVGYTGGPMPLAYVGLGDIFVFAFFGPLAVAGTRAACDGSWTSLAWWCGVAPGAIAVALLATNNLRDRVGDALNNKRTLAVRFGSRFTRAQIVICHLCAIVVPISAVVVWKLPQGALAASLLALLMIPISISIVGGRDGVLLNRTLAGFGAMLYLYGVAFAIGVRMSGVFA